MHEKSNQCTAKHFKAMQFDVTPKKAKQSLKQPCKVNGVGMSLTVYRPTRQVLQNVGFVSVENDDPSSKLRP